MMTNAITDAGGRHPLSPLFATLTRTLPRLGAGLGLFDAPIEPAGNSRIRFSPAEKHGVDLTV